MGLTGIQIFKLLPKTNCTECGVPTCLAFAMNLASGKAELGACPYVSEEAKEQLAEASAPPIRPVKIGSGDTQVTSGGETVMFRHEKTFFNRPGFAVLITTDMDDATIETKLSNYLAYQYERVGLNLRPELVAIKDVTGDAGRFESVIKLVQNKSDFSYILMSEDPGLLKAGVKASVGFKPLIYPATKNTADELSGISKEFGCPVAIKAESLEQLREISEKMTAAGVKDLVLDSGSREIQKAFQDQIALRRAALIGKDRALGFPTICFPCEMADNLDMETLIASMFVAKYGGLMVMSDFQGESIFPLLVERLNIFTDPQRPMTVTQGVYEINGPNENSPICVTSNFSLTYFIVTGEIESSRVPTWLLIMDTEGLSVMTAWAAGKFVGDAVASFVKKSGIADKIQHKNIIIPGYAASISGDMEEELPGWKVWTGPREAAHIPKYLKEWKAQ
jgi:acetyl-CoA decarbonylase/synthase complex subunit gamma